MSDEINKEKKIDRDFSYDAVLAQGKAEVKSARDLVRSKRVELRNRIRLYNNQRKQKDKIGDTTIFNIITTLLAIYYSDKSQVSFSGREVGDVSAAQNTEYLYNFDYDEMEMEVLNYMVQWDRFFFGVGIRQLTAWNKKTTTPDPKTLNPLTWLPDPNGHLLAKNFRFMGFEVQYTRRDMTEEAGFFNQENLKIKKTPNGSEQEQNETAYWQAQGLDYPAYRDSSSKEGEVFDMIDQFMILKGSDGKERKFLVTFNDDVTEIFRMEEIEPVTAAERVDPSLIPWPITLNYYAPNRTDPFGTSVPDLVEDKQRAKSVIKNLQIAAVKADIYPMYLYNRDKILNRRDLDFAFNKFIAIRGDVDDNVVKPLNKADPKLAAALNTNQWLDADIEAATGADKNTQGVLSEHDRTLGEVQQTTANANLRFLLGSKINSWGDRRFVKLWYRLYKQNFKSADKKIVRIQSGIGDSFMALSRKDFITVNDPDIKIGSKIEMEQKRMRDRVAFAAVLPLINADPTKPQVSKRFAERRLLKLYDLPAEEIAIISPDTPDEMKAKMENELLDKNNLSDVKIEVGEDHLSHMVIHNQAEKTEANLGHTQAHKMAYFQSGQAEESREIYKEFSKAGGQQGAANSLANQDASLNGAKDQPQNISPGDKA